MNVNIKMQYMLNILNSKLMMIEKDYYIKKFIIMKINQSNYHIKDKIIHYLKIRYQKKYKKLASRKQHIKDMPPSPIQIVNKTKRLSKPPNRYDPSNPKMETSIEDNNNQTNFPQKKVHFTPKVSSTFTSTCNNNYWTSVSFSWSKRNRKEPDRYSPSSYIDVKQQKKKIIKDDE